MRQILNNREWHQWHIGTCCFLWGKQSEKQAKKIKKMVFVFDKSKYRERGERNRLVGVLDSIRLIRILRCTFGGGAGGSLDVTQ